MFNPENSLSLDMTTNARSSILDGARSICTIPWEQLAELMNPNNSDSFFCTAMCRFIIQRRSVRCGFSPEAMIIARNKELQIKVSPTESVKASSSAMINIGLAFPAWCPGAEVRQPVVKVSRFFESHARWSNLDPPERPDDPSSLSYLSIDRRTTRQRRASSVFPCDAPQVSSLA